MVEELLTVKELAEKLKVIPETIRRYIRRGELPAVKAGRVLRLDRKNVDLFLARLKDGQNTRPVVAVLHEKDGSLAEGEWPIIGQASNLKEAIALARKSGYRTVRGGEYGTIPFEVVYRRQSEGPDDVDPFAVSVWK